jgi:hypothetical protein
MITEHFAIRGAAGIKIHIIGKVVGTVKTCRHKGVLLCVAHEMHVQKRKAQYLIPVENRYYLANQVTFEVNMFKLVFFEYNEFLLPAIPNAIGQPVPVGLNG